MGKQLFIFIHEHPILFLNVESKKEGVEFLKEYFSTHKEKIYNMDIANYVHSVNYSSIARLLFYVEVEEYDNDIVFHTYRLNSEGKKIIHLSYNVNRSNKNNNIEYLLSEDSKIVTQYKAYKRKRIIQKFLDNE